ncbi:MAG: alanine dehydrogenase [Gammaproteobacteria bacterium]|nr:alanine dehydrogenase [Gammaproteobacteria bacterium]
MRIGIVKEIKTMEGRVALIPAAVAELVGQGHEVLVQQNAGLISGYADHQYQALGARIMPSAKVLYDESEIVVKVKEPQPAEVAMLRPDQILFSYLHLAAEPDLAAALMKCGVTALAFETVEDPLGRLPLLAPMSDIAGRIAAQAGCHYLHRPLGGKGLLLGGLPAAERGKVVIVGAGVAGYNAATVVASLGATVVVFDYNRDKLAAVRALGDNVTGLYPYADQVKAEATSADLLIGAVLVTGERAPHVVDKETVASMEAGSVIVDISVDQGGCVATTRPTTYQDPTYEIDGVVHFCVTNMPGAVPKTASQALSASLIPYVSALAQAGWTDNAELMSGINIQGGALRHPGLIKSLGFAPH